MAKKPVAPKVDKRLHVVVEIPGLLRAALILAHILKGGTLSDGELAVIGDNIQELAEPTRKLREAVTAASPKP